MWYWAKSWGREAQVDPWFSFSDAMGSKLVKAVQGGVAPVHYII
jgi:hypothetical protein